MIEDNEPDSSFEDVAKTDTRTVSALLMNAMNDVKIVCVRDGVLLPRMVQEQLLLVREHLNIALSLVELAQPQCSCGFRALNQIDYEDHLATNNCPRTERS